MDKFIERIIIAAFIIFAICLYTFVKQPSCVYGAEPRIDDQGDTPMCGVYSVCNAVEYQMQIKGIETPEGGFDKQWLWDKCAEREDMSDGIELSTALDIACEYGLCPAGVTENQDEEATKYKIATYSAINFKSFEYYLANGHAILVGTTLDRENWKDGILTSSENQTSEGHATYLIGFDRSIVLNGIRDYYIGVNSWGDKWGFGGKYYMEYYFAYGIPWAYVVEL